MNRSRGWLLLALVFGLPAAAVCGQTAAKPPPVDFDPLRIEQVKLAGYSAPAWGRWLEPEQNQSGVPLGGLGTGYLELRSDGRFHDSVLQNNWTVPRPPASGSLVLSTKQNGKPSSALLLGSVVRGGNVTASEPRPRYFGHYPMADLEYGRLPDAPLHVTVRAFSPFVPGDPALSNTPAALLKVTVANRSDQRLPCDLSFTWGDPYPPAAAGSRPEQFGTTNGGYALAGSGMGWKLSAPEGGAARVGTELRAATELAPGAEKTVTFVLAWHFGSWRTTDGRVVMNRYAARFTSATEVGRFALENAADIERKIIEWQEAVYKKGIPDWLKDGAVNSLQLFCRNSLWLEDGRFFVSGSLSGQGMLEPVATRFTSSLPLLLHFPALELQVMRELARGQSKDGQIPASYGPLTGVNSVAMEAQKPLASAEFAVLCWRDYAATADTAFLEELFPAAKKALQYAATLDTDANGLINETAAKEGAAGGPFDNWAWQGTSAYTGGISLAAWRAGEELARAAGDAEFEKWCRDRSEKGRRAYDEDLWTGRYYRLFTDPDDQKQSEICLLNQLCGQGTAWLYGLGDLHPSKNAFSALRTVAELNGKPTEWGAVNGATEAGAADDSGAAQSAELLPSEAWSYATAALLASKAQDDAELREAALEIAQWSYSALLKSGSLWNPHWIYRGRDGAALSGPQHTSMLSLWGLVVALEGRIPLPGAKVGR